MDMVLKEEKGDEVKAARNKATLAKLHESPDLIAKIREGYAQIERGESVTVTLDDLKKRFHIVEG